MQVNPATTPLEGENVYWALNFEEVMRLTFIGTEGKNRP